MSTEAKHELREQEPTPLPVIHRLVIWQNLWNWTQEESGTTRIHITSAAGLSGKTLCGRPFPATKGYPVAVRFCKRCVTAAQRAGVSKESVRALAYVGGIGK